MASVERLYIARYMASKWPEGGYSLGVPLGPVPQALIKEMGYKEAAQLAHPWRPEVDAIKYTPTGIIMIEGKVFRFTEAFAFLTWYASLIPKTEELRPWWGMQNQLRVVVPRPTDVLMGLAEASGVVVDAWSSPEIEPYLQRYQRYWTKEYQLQRALDREKLQAMGIQPHGRKAVLGRPGEGG